MALSMITGTIGLINVLCGEKITISSATFATGCVASIVSLGLASYQFSIAWRISDHTLKHSLYALTGIFMILAVVTFIGGIVGYLLNHPLNDETKSLEA